MRKNFSKDQAKRPWKTPSPSHHNELKSPRFLRAGLTRHESNKNIRDEDGTSPKHNNFNQSFKTKLLGLKQEGKIVKSGSENRLSSPDQPHQGTKYKNQYDETTPYNSYYDLHSNRSNQQEKPRQTRNISSKNESHQEDHDILIISKASPSHKRYHETLRRLINENDRIKKENESLREQLNGSRAVQKQKKMKRRQFISKNVVSSAISSELACELKDEIEDLKRQVEKGRQEEIAILEQNNRLKLEVSALQAKANETTADCDKICEVCQESRQHIQELTSSLETKIYESSKKDSIISSLCSQIKSLENEIKTLEKPKNILKKLNVLICDTNNQMMKSRAIQSSRKYAEPESKGEVPGKADKKFKSPSHLSPRHNRLKII